jgi:hypothetical protein
VQGRLEEGCGGGGRQRSLHRPRLHGLHVQVSIKTYPLLNTSITPRYWLYIDLARNKCRVTFRNLSIYHLILKRVALGLCKPRLSLQTAWQSNNLVCCFFSLTVRSLSALTLRVAQ